MPLGSDGYYLLSTFFKVFDDHDVFIYLFVNGITVCTMNDDNVDSTSDEVNGGCSTVVFLAEG